MFYKRHHKDNKNYKTTKEKHEMTTPLQNYLKTLEDPREKLINTIADKCHVQRRTVLMWIRGQVTPPALYRDAVSEIVNIPAEELWPNGSCRVRP